MDNIIAKLNQVVNISPTDSDAGQLEEKLLVTNGLSITKTADALGKETLTIGVGNSDGQFLVPDGTAAAPGLAFQDDTNTGIFRQGSGDVVLSLDGVSRIRYSGTEQRFEPAGKLSWASVGISAPDLFLQRDAANTLAQRNGVNAQTFNLYNTFTDAANFERLGIKYDTNVITFSSEAGGTGTKRAFTFNNTLTIDQNDNLQSLVFDSEAIAANVIDIVAQNLTFNVFKAQCDTLTSGSMFNFTSNSPNASDRNLGFIHNDHVSAVNAITLALQNDGTGDAGAGSYLKFNNTPAANTTEAVTSFTVGATLQGYVKINVDGTTRFMQFYDAPTS